jgi:transcriptional regulator with GAF, ATPase, and Fis domain
MDRARPWAGHRFRGPAGHGDAELAALRLGAFAGNRLTAIHELSLRLAQLRDVDAIVEAIVAEVGRLVDCDTVRVYRDDPVDGGFRPVAASGTFLGIASPPLEAITSGHAETLPGWVAKRNEPLIVPDAAAERGSIFRSTFGAESLLLVPMAYGDEVHGVLVVSKAGAGKYGGQTTSRRCRSSAGTPGQAIVNAGNIERLERQQATLERQLAGEGGFWTSASSSCRLSIRARSSSRSPTRSAASSTTTA